MGLHKITQGIFVTMELFISWLYWWIHGHTHVMSGCRTGLHTQMNTGNWNKSVDCFSVHVLVMILCFIFVKCYLVPNWVKCM